MRLASASILAFVLLACATPARQYRVSGQVTANDAFATAQSAVTDMGYTVVDAERDAGLLVAEKEEGGKGLMGTGIQVDRLTVNLHDDGTVTVTASSEYGDEVTEPDSGAVSDEAKEDAEELRRRLTGESG